MAFVDHSNGILMTGAGENCQLLSQSGIDSKQPDQVLLCKEANRKHVTMVELTCGSRARTGCVTRVTTNRRFVFLYFVTLRSYRLTAPPVVAKCLSVHHVKPLPAKSCIDKIDTSRGFLARHRLQTLTPDFTCRVPITFSKWR